MVFRTWLENWSWSLRINQFNPRPLAQNAPQSVVAFKLSASIETTISKSSTHKSFNVDPLYMAQQIVRFSYKERKCNSLKSSLFFETHCLFWKTMRNHHCIVLKQLLFDRGKQWERRESESEREKKPWSLSNAKNASIESSNWWPQRGLKDLSPLFKSLVFAYLMT